jgi:hypothetical protein
MERRKFLIGGLATTVVCFEASATPPPLKQGQLQWMARIKG